MRLSCFTNIRHFIFRINLEIKFCIFQKKVRYHFMRVYHVIRYKKCFLHSVYEYSPILFSTTNTKQNMCMSFHKSNNKKPYKNISRTSFQSYPMLYYDVS